MKSLSNQVNSEIRTPFVNIEIRTPFVQVNSEIRTPFVNIEIRTPFVQVNSEIRTPFVQDNIEIRTAMMLRDRYAILTITMAVKAAQIWASVANMKFPRRSIHPGKTGYLNRFFRSQTRYNRLARSVRVCVCV